MPAIFHYDHTVRDDEIDAQGHANNVCYVAWMKAAAWPIPPPKAGPPRPTSGWPGLGRASHTIEYHSPGRRPDHGQDLGGYVQAGHLGPRRYHILRKAGRRGAGHRRDQMGLHRLCHRPAPPRAARIARAFEIVGTPLLSSKAFPTAGQ